MRLENMNSLIPALSTEEVYYFMGYYQGILAMIENYINTSKYINVDTLRGMLEIEIPEEPEDKEEETDF